MLSELRLQGLGVIAEAIVPLGAGFTAITGETGAGKTMVLQALGMVTGSKVEATAVRRGSDRAVVEARIYPTAGSAEQQRAAEVGAELDDDGALVAVRTLNSQGRSRAVLGGVAVPAGVLAEVVGGQVAVHGQHDQQRLLRPAQQRLALDRFAGVTLVQQLVSYEVKWSRWIAVRSQLKAFRAADVDRRREIDLLSHGLQRIAALAPRTGEDDSLRAEADVLAHADALHGAASESVSLLVGDDEQTLSALSARVHRVLNDVAEHDARMREWALRAKEISVLAVELGADISAQQDSFEANPNRLEEVATRRAAISELSRVYTDAETGSGSDGLVVWATRAEVRLAALGESTHNIQELEREVSELEIELATMALEMRTVRQKSASQLGVALSEELRALGMAQAVIEVAVLPLSLGNETLCVDDIAVPAGPRGIDEIELRIAAHPGAEPGPLSKVASGGELSRVMLALEVIVAGSGDATTLVFDEVDAGVGGRAALEVGRRLARLARSHQVVVVTHLAQVAAYADHHLVVNKDVIDQTTTSAVIVVAGSQRREELARMMAGDALSGSANEHAGELLERAAQECNAMT